MHTISCGLERNWSLWEHFCTKLRPRLTIERAPTTVFIMPTKSDHNTLPSTEEDWEVLLRPPKEVAADNEQRDVEGGDQSC
jgi:hypothetical protein